MSEYLILDGWKKEQGPLQFWYSTVQQAPEPSMDLSQFACIKWRSNSSLSVKCISVFL